MLSHDAVKKCEYEYNHRQIFEKKGGRARDVRGEDKTLRDRDFDLC
jgi:hypothetical protein